MKKPLILLVILSSLILSAGCATGALYHDYSTYDFRKFTEEISSFLITKDDKQLIVVGKEHHYIFPTDEALKFILTWPEKKRVKAEFSDFHIGSSNQSVRGTYTLTVDAGSDLAPETRKLLISKGFNEDNAQKTLSYRNEISGTRYLAGEVKLPATMQLNQKYTITIEQASKSAAKVMGRILLTPLAVLADGVMAVGVVPVYLFMGLGYLITH